ncbi:MAG: putative ATP-dependent endonuclease of the family [Euryarchaeota archaeon]|nr:putative ATP-dependent endonuclease of the family [Euryarchaeota archaeon]
MEVIEMKIKQIEIDGFRCLCNFKITFEDNITVIVGENDSGKSSIISCLNLFTEDYPLEIDDFNYEKDVIKIKLITESFEYIKEYKRETYLNPNFTIKPSSSYMQEKKEFMASLTSNLTKDQELKI